MTDEEIYNTVVKPLFQKIVNGDPHDIIATITNEELYYLIAFNKVSLGENGIPDWDA